MNDADWLNERADLAPETTIRSRPILFSGPMVRALLDGRKTQTRRVVKPQPPEGRDHCWVEYPYGKPMAVYKSFDTGSASTGLCECPYGQPGDTLYVKETWQAWHRCSVEYDEWEPITRSWLNDRGLATVTDARDQGYVDSIEYRATSKSVGPWRSGRFMPRSASRLTLKLTDVRVERLQSISEEDAIKEGCEVRQRMLGHGEVMPRQVFRDTWDQLNAKRGFGWDVNPWVWVLSFERITGEAGV